MAIYRAMTSPRLSSTEVASRIHRVPLIGATAYVILEDEITVIDAGLRGSLPRLHAWITSVGRSPQEVRRFVITHAHPDHIGGAADANILLHPADRERPLRFNAGTIARRLSRLPATIDMADGDVIPALGGLRVIHTPGHTPGSVCLYAEREGIVFVPFFPLRGERSPAMARLGRRHRATSRQVMLAWLLKRSPVVLPIPGTLSLEHLKENLAAGRIDLDEEEFASLV